MKKSLMIVGLCMTALLFANCGDGDSSSTSAASDSSGSSVNLTGSIQAPVASTSISSPSLSKNISSKAVTEAAAASAVVHFYTLEGEHLGEATTAADGTFTFPAVIATLKGSEDSTTFTEPIICDCPDKGIQLYAEVTVTEGTTTSVAIGTADADTTLAAISALKKVSGFDLDLLKAGSSFKSAASAIDLKCLFETEKARWENASLSSTGGIADDNGAIRETMMAFMASGKKPSDAGYSDFNGMFDEVLSGTADDSGKWSSIVGFADDYVDSSYHAKIADYAGAYNATSAMDTIFARDIAPTAGSGAVAYSISKALSTTSICDDIKSGAIDPDALIKTMFESDNIGALAETFTADGMKVMFGLMEQCQVKRAEAAAVIGSIDDPCETMVANPGSYYGFMNSGKDNFAEVWNGSAFDPTVLEGWFMAAESCKGGTGETMEDCAAGMHGTIYEGDGMVDWGQFKTDGDFDAAKFDTMGGYWTGQVAEGNYDPSTFDEADYTNAMNQFEGVFTGTTDDAIKSCVDAIFAAGLYDTSACYAGFDDAGSLDSGSATQVQQYMQGSGGQQFIQQYYEHPM